MKKIMKISFLVAGLLVVLVLTFYSCGGDSSYGGGGGGGTASPGTLMLASPADAATGVGTTPTFTWTPSTSASGYRVQVDTSGAFTGTLVINVLVGATTYSYTAVPADTLVAGTLYYWRVVAENVYGQATAGPRSFTP